ncbi:MAG: PBP1A family penicillin-binding protein [Patescibacteria group bacterium]
MILKSKLKKKIKLIMAWGGVALFVMAGFSAIWFSTLKIPSLESFEERKITESTKIYDKTGEILLFDVFNGIKRSIVPFEEISENIKKATLAIEDVDFYQHKGIKPTAIIRAVLVNLGALRFDQGGSTITQQVVKNSILTGEKKISRKIKEWILAIKIERILEKDEIFSLYLNEIPYGGNIYGIEEASRAFFGKKSQDLSIAESAYLAALPKAPSFYSPYKNKEGLEKRKNLVLQEMLRNNFITEEEHDVATKEVVEFKPREDQGIKAPHFVLFVKDQLEKKYGQQVLETGGLKVITTLDYEMQKKAEELAKKHAEINKEKFNAENLALVAIDPKNGQILTMVGSRDYFDEEIDGNFNVATAHRQPGSAFKPFAYAAAFNIGYTPETVLFDLPTVFTANCTPQGVGKDCYAPQNYDNVFRGPISMREALAQSINVPSVKTLYLAGLENTLGLAKAMGIQNLSSANFYGLTLVLGGGEVSLLDITSAYGVFANSGVRVPYESILKIEDRDGNTLEESKSEPRQVLQEETADKISDILSDNAARTPAFGASSYLYFPNRDVAVKTGTTNDYKDAWIIGYTPSLVVGAWAGNNNNTSMEKKVAGFIIAPFWNEFMQTALKSVPIENFVRLPKETSLDLKPVLRGKWQGGDSYFIDRISGKLATEYTPIETIEEIVTGEVRSILYSVTKSDPRGPTPSNPETDSQFALWDYPVQEWVKRQGIVTQNPQNLPTGHDDVHVPEFFPRVEIKNPDQGERFQENDIVRVEIEVNGRFQTASAQIFVNDNFLGNIEAPFTNFSFVPEEVGLTRGENTLKVTVTDVVYNKGSDEIEFDVR